jgi:hypothetical protein
MAAMTVVTTRRHVYREAPTALGHGPVQRACAIALHAGSSRGLESEECQDLLHRDFGAQHVEVYAGHG